ncbi:MAG: putative molybdenum carrier protein [Gammaproteobacteria bacterium]
MFSGEQPGVDRTTLNMALQYGTACGGWCPEGRKAEDGRIPDKYSLKELKAGGAYRQYKPPFRWLTTGCLA